MPSMYVAGLSIYDHPCRLTELQAAIVTTGKKAFPKAMNLLKPQRTFDVVPTNDDVGPFKPLLTSKPHAQVPLYESLVLEKDST